LLFETNNETFSVRRVKILISSVWDRYRPPFQSTAAVPTVRVDRGLGRLMIWADKVNRNGSDVLELL